MRTIREALAHAYQLGSFVPFVASGIIILMAGLWVTTIFVAIALVLAWFLYRVKRELAATLSKNKNEIGHALKLAHAEFYQVPISTLQSGDEILCEAGSIIPIDGDVIEGTAIVDESAITGESAPVLREAALNRCSVVVGSRVLTNHLRIRVRKKKTKGELQGNENPFQTEEKTNLEISARGWATCSVILLGLILGLTAILEPP